MTSRFVKALILILLIVVITDAQVILDDKTRNYDQLHIKLEITPDFEAQTISGIEQFTFTPLIKMFDTLVLHCKSTEVKRVKYKNTPLEFSQNGELLFIYFKEQYSQKDTITISIEYISTPRRGIYFFKPLPRTPEIPYQLWSQGQGTENRNWYPAYDLPDDKLTFELIVRVPENMLTVSNGKLIRSEPEEGGTRLYYWKMDTPYSNYLTTLIAGEFATITEKIRGVTLEYHVPHGWEDEWMTVFGRTARMMSFFSDYILFYPFERYAQTTVQDFEYGGMENITATTLNKRVLHKATARPNYTGDDLIAHELAHQWWGDIVTCHTGEHIWLNEGFATYFTALWEENAHGWDEFRFSAMSMSDGYKNSLYDKSNDTSFGKRKVPPALQDGNAYGGGATILDMLRYELGDKVFQEGIRNYIRKFMYSTAVTEDFRKVMEEVSGKNLTTFFTQWLYDNKLPHFSVSYTYDKIKKKVLLNVKQEIKGRHDRIFITKMPIEIVASEQVIRKDIFIHKKEQTFDFSLSTEPEYIDFNNGYRIMCSVTFQRSFEELSTQSLYDTEVPDRIKALRELKQFGVKALSVLRQSALNDMFYGVRLAAVELVGQMSGKEAADILLAATSDADPRVRESAYMLLANFKGFVKNEFLKKNYSLEQNEYVLSAILYAYGKLGFEDSFQFISSQFEVPSHRNIIRRRIFNALREIKNPGALKQAREFVEYKHSPGDMHQVNLAALEYAAEFFESHKAEVEEIILAALNNYYFRTRNAAAELMVRFGMKQYRNILGEVLKNERRQIVTDVLLPALKKLESRE